MDIRSIIESNSPAPAQARSAKQVRQQPDRAFQGAFEAPPPPRNAHGGTRPPPPPPLQPPSQPQSHVELPSPSLSSYASVQSPYQQTPSSTLSGGQYPFPQAPNQSPGHGFKASPYAHQENHINIAGGYGPSPPLPSTPLTTAPDNSHPYPHQQRQNSVQSLTTPTSAQSQLSSFSKMSPQTLQPQVRALSQSHSAQQYHSQPGTPLGPPPSYGRPIPSLHKDQSGSYEHHRSHSGSSHGYQQVLATSPRTDIPGGPADSSRDYEPRRPHPGMHHVPKNGDRERTLSVSPKTKLPIQPQGKHIPVPLQTSQSWDEKVSPTKRKLGDEFSGDPIVHHPAKDRIFQEPVRSRSLAVNGILNAAPVHDRYKDPGEPSPKRQNTVILPPTAKLEPSPSSESFIQQESYQFSTSKPSIETQPGHSSISRPSTESQPGQFSTSRPSTETQPGHFSTSRPSTETQPGQFSTSRPSTETQSGQFSTSRPSTETQSGQFSTSRPSTEIQSGSRPSNPHSPGFLKSPPSQTGQRPLMPSSVALSPASPTVLQKSAMQQLPSHYSAGTITSAHPPQPPLRIKRRPVEVPIYARSSRPDGRCTIVIPASRQSNFSAGKPAISTKDEPRNATNVSTLVHSQPVVSTSEKHEQKYETNGSAPAGGSSPLTKAQPIFADQGPLGPWEPSIINVIPSEEMTRIIADYLFNEVVNRNDVGVGPAGGGVSMGAAFEIEAKIGQLIDKNTNERLRLPIMSECVLSPNDPNLKIAFKSSMTEAQHRALNIFLNNALVNSQPSKTQAGTVQPAGRPRIPMSYVHTYESDSFFELSQSGILILPASIRAELHHARVPKAKIRVTVDQKTGKEIARIVKVRCADLDVYSPRTPFDWRVSVNIEMSVDGDLWNMVDPSSTNGKRHERNKDRMSYRHLAYQIDLTQVTSSEAISKTEKEHELEIEVSSAEVRKQGLLASNGLPNDYESLIRGFVDNVRLLARQCQQS